MSGKKKKEVKIADIVLTLKMIIKAQLCLTLTVDFFVSILFPIVLWFLDSLWYKI